MLGIAQCKSSSGRSQLALHDIGRGRVALLESGVDDLPSILADKAGLSSRLTALSDGARWLDEAEVRFLAPLSPAARIFCVAQNYASHALEASGTGSPPVPVLFLKPQSAFVGHGGYASIPSVSTFFDYESEIAVVVGAELAGVDEEEAAKAIVGVSAANDATARDLQSIELGGRTIIDWFSAKSTNDSSSLGPSILPVESVGAFADLPLRGTLNGDIVQDDVASSMNHSVGMLLSFISHRVTLMPGDIVLTGTPSGVGKARGRALAPGDVLEVQVGPMTLRSEFVAG